MRTWDKQCFVLSLISLGRLIQVTHPFGEGGSLGSTEGMLVGARWLLCSMSCPLEKVPVAPSSSEQALRSKLDPGALLGASLTLVLTSPHTLNNSISQCWDLGLITHSRSRGDGWPLCSLPLIRVLAKE